MTSLQDVNLGFILWKIQETLPIIIFLLEFFFFYYSDPSELIFRNFFFINLFKLGISEIVKGGLTYIDKLLIIQMCVIFVEMRL